MINMPFCQLFFISIVVNGICTEDNIVYHKFENDFSSDMFANNPQPLDHGRSVQDSQSHQESDRNMHNLLQLKQFELQFRELKQFWNDLAHLKESSMLSRLLF